MRIRLLLVLFAALSQSALADDVYIVQGRTIGRPSIESGTRTQWSTDVLFVNRDAAPQTIRLLDISNGGVHPTQPSDFLLPGNRSTSLTSIRPGWQPGTTASLWVLHVDVPPVVQVDDVLYIGTVYPDLLISPSSRPYRFGSARLPVFRSLAKAGEPQIHAATDLGPEVPSHINVAIYNAAALPAHASIEVREHCDDALLLQRDELISPDAIVQLPAFPTLTLRCGEPLPGTIAGPVFSLYVVIRVDQPSLSLVSTVADKIEANAILHLSGRP